MRGEGGAQGRDASPPRAFCRRPSRRSAGVEAYRSRANFNTVVESLNEALPVPEAARLARPAVFELTSRGFTLAKSLSKLDGAPGRLPPLVEGGVAAPKLQSSDPLPLVCASLERWAAVTGARVGVLPPPAAPVPPPPAPGGEGGDVAAPAAPPPPSFDPPEDRNVEVAYKHMFTTLEDRAAALEGRLSEMADAIVAAHGLAELLVPVGAVSQTPVVCVGRVCVDGEGKINPASVMLEGNTRGPLAAVVPSARVLLDLRDVPSFSLFPGQVVGVRGLFTSGSSSMLVQARRRRRQEQRPPPAAPPHTHASPCPSRLQEIYHGAVPGPLVAPLANASAEAAAIAAVAPAGGPGPLRVWAASGPYCLHGNLEYNPLADLKSEVAEGRTPAPDVLVLVRRRRREGAGRGRGELRHLPPPPRRWAPLWTPSTRASGPATSP